VKKHETIPVTAKHVISSQQFPKDHETPTADIFPAGSVAPWEEKELRKTHPYVSEDRMVRVPHDKLRAGQMVVDTNRVKALMENPHTHSGMEATGLPDGTYMLEDGHHHVAADILSGRRKTADVRLRGRWERP